MRLRRKADSRKADETFLKSKCRPRGGIFAGLTVEMSYVCILYMREITHKAQPDRLIGELAQFPEAFRENKRFPLTEIASFVN